MYHVAEFFQRNPRATIGDAANYFSQEFDIPKQVEILRDEANRYVEIRKELQPLHARKREVEEQLKFASMDIDAEVMLKYPPRQGTDAKRKEYRTELQQASAHYQALDTEYTKLNEKIFDLDGELELLDRAAKAARRLTELYQEILAFIPKIQRP